MNEFSGEKKAAIKRLLAMGASNRAIAAAVGCSSNAIVRYSKMWRVDVACGCGQKAGHRGWCSVRLEYSPVRRAWLQTRWKKRAESEVSAAVDRAVKAARALGHTLGPFIWSSSVAASLAFAICRTCGKQVRVFSGDSQWARYEGWERFAGNAVRVRCRTVAERAAEEAARNEKRAWRNGKVKLIALRRALRDPSRWPSAGSPLAPSSPR